MVKRHPDEKFSHAAVAVDVVVFTVVEGKLNVLLIEMNKKPFIGKWAAPGGLVEPDESLDKAAQRLVSERAGIKDTYLEQLYTFGDPARDPNGWVVSVAYLALVPFDKFKPKTTQNYKSIGWVPVDALPPLAYDHDLIIQTAKKRLISKLGYTNVVYSLMPSEFTLGQLQDVYESVIGEELDKRNFRKKINSLGILESLPKKTKGDAHRPAQLYKFTSKSPQELNIL